jgi:hypothetical protein
MDPRLSHIIADYQMRVAEAVALLERAGYARPSSDSGWEAMEGPALGELAAGYRFFKHGFGCAVRGPGWKVDFDFGEAGQVDGFEPARLKEFIAGHLDQYGIHAEHEIDQMFARAREDGELVFSGYELFYLVQRAG